MVKYYIYAYCYEVVIKLRYRTKILFNLIICSFIPTFLVLIIYMFVTISLLKDSQSERIEYNNSLIINSIEANINYVRKLSIPYIKDDTLISRIKEFNNESSDNINDIRSQLATLSYGLEGCRAVTLITENNELISYNTINGYKDFNIWSDNDNKNVEKLYDDTVKNYISHSNHTYYYKKQNKKYDFIDFSTKIIDFTTGKTLGIIIISMEQEFIWNSIPEFEGGKLNLYVKDNNNKIIISNIGESISSDYDKFIDKNEEFKYNTVSKYIDSNKWTITLINKNDIIDSRFKTIIFLALTCILFIFILTTSLIKRSTDNLSKSIYNIVDSIKKIKKGNIKIRVNINSKDEIAYLADEFNVMLDEMDRLLRKVILHKELEKEAIMLQKEAEIKSLEYQINPHFLYNSLDSIRWLALESNSNDVAEVIEKFTNIMRYSINNKSNIVSIEELVIWIKEYIFIQKKCFEYSFNEEVFVDTSLNYVYVYKFIVQPFIENSIVHGLKGVKLNGRLNIVIREYDIDNIFILINDTGIGMSEYQVNKLNKLFNGDEEINESEYSIGLLNVLKRLKGYYNNNFIVEFESVYGIGTKVSIIIPKEGAGHNNENFDSRGFNKGYTWIKELN